MQKYIIIKNTAEILAGITLKVNTQPENFNMGLHTAQDTQAVIKNRQKFASDFNLQLNQLVCAKQTHSDHLVKVTKAQAGAGSIDYETAIEDCDALYTKDKGVCLSIFTADCVPVLMFDPIKEIICVVHAGWQGTVKEVTAKSIAYLKEHEDVNPANLKITIGPAICQNNFEVGIDVIEKMHQMSFDTEPFYTYNNDTLKAYVDNKGLNIQQCLNEGVLKENITVDKNCTYANQENFFSYRQDKNCGRHMSFLMMKEK